ncbi:unnamed protein product [Rotaria sordida]|uniref:Caspase family p20 domain-containing protein n=1 Tax=Rotaria sordida TaxID=392033 RepID=A0A819GDJ5_9BILA|nr:unnamed protein product [Rotaria sordida]CAF3884044.1 unnamed protein product [Rotaria sordida]
MAYVTSSISKSTSEKKALLIGNNAYKRENTQLQCCINDATDLCKKLRTIQFQVTVGSDLTHEQMDRMIDDFTIKINPGDLVVFFFSGHGTQWNDQNFLMPVDNDRINERKYLKHGAINAQATLEKIMDRCPLAAIFLLDCCRKYYMRNDAAVRSLNTPSGLSSMQAVVAIAQYRVGSNVDLSQHELIDQDMEIIAKEVVIKKRCIQLWLGSNSITSDGALILADVLKNNHILEKLDLHNNRISDDGVRFLVKTLSGEQILTRAFKNQISTVLSTISNNKGDLSAKNEIMTVCSHIFTAFPNLLYLNFHQLSDRNIERLSFDCQIPMFSSTLIELHIKVQRFDDILYLLDGRFNKLCIFYVDVINIACTRTSLPIINNKVGYFTRKQQLLLIY